MEPRITFITLAARDLDATRRFYVDGLGWAPELDVPGEVVMIRTGEHLVLSLWDEAGFEAEVGADRPRRRRTPVHAGPQRRQPARRSTRSSTMPGGRAPRSARPQERDWGGYTGYFAGPDGVRWEIAWNPGEIGRLVLPDEAGRLVSGAMTGPSGDQFEIAGGGYRAVVTECGATLRLLDYAGRPVVHGFAEDEMSGAARGQLLVPWPNRIRDGAYTFDGRDLQLGLTEPSRHNASHGLVRWAAWTPEEHAASSVSLSYRLMAQSGYPWTLDLHVLYDLSADGLTVTQTATNLGDRPAPYASGRPSLPHRRRRSGRRLGADPAGVPPAALRRPSAAGRRGGRRGHAVRLPDGAAAARHRGSTTRSASSSATTTASPRPSCATRPPDAAPRCGWTGTTRG